MRRFDFSCDPCGVSFEFAVEAGQDTPQNPPCPQCGVASQRVWTAPAAIVRGTPMEITARGAVPVDSRFEPHGRSAEQVERAHRKFVKAKAKLANQRKRARGASKSTGFRHLGAVPVHQLLAHQRQTGDKHVMTRDPIGFLKRTGNYFGD